MATVATVAADRPWIVGLASTFTVYATYVAARDAAITASAANASAPYYTAKVEAQVTAPKRFDLSPGVPGPEAWIIQAASTATYLPKSKAESQAFVTSAANTNALTYVAKVFQNCVGP
jgi:hypothetical protein